MELRYLQTYCSQQAHGSLHCHTALSIIEGCLTLLTYSDLETLTFPARNRFWADKRKKWKDLNTQYFSFLFQSSFKPPLALQIPKSPLNQGHAANRIWANVQLCLFARWLGSWLFMTMYNVMASPVATPHKTCDCSSLPLGTSVCSQEGWGAIPTPGRFSSSRG